MNTLIIIISLIMDRLLGEPRRYHPLVGFGLCAAWLEARMNRPDGTGYLGSRISGGIAWLILVTPIPLLLLLLLNLWPSAYWWVSLLCLYLCIGWKSLSDHASRVAEALEQDNLQAAKWSVSRLVSRDTETMDEPAIVRATIESVLENGSDAVFAPLLWFLIAGPVGVVAYRCANTLDAMWGYRTSRFARFGYWSAKVDDALNYIPARLTALSYSLSGKTRLALHCWQQQAAGCASPNGGPVMCSGAGALGVRLGGGAFYHGVWRESAHMGSGSSAKAVFIGSALGLIRKSLWLWVVAIALLELLLSWSVVV